MTHLVANHAAAFHNASAALAYLDSQPDDGGCMPVCEWKCTTPKCAQICEPECEAPHCESRCTQDTSSCVFSCQEPSCALVCDEGACATDSPCPKCKAVCGEPVCNLVCPGAQPCTTVCAEPACQYNCKKPEDCPEPKCELKCDTPPTCTDLQVSKDLPPPKEGETVATTFQTSPEVLQAASGTSKCPPGCAEDPAVFSATSPGRVVTTGTKVVTTPKGVVTLNTGKASAQPPAPAPKALAPAPVESTMASNHSVTHHSQLQIPEGCKC